ncbi:insulinase family protein [bacterium]|nr:insulinase family protein [bacterium]
MKHLRIFIVAAVLLLVGGQATAQIDRSKQPEPGPAPKASFPEYYETQLDNGLKVFVVSNHAEPVVNFRLLVKSGSENDGAHSGVAEFTTDLMTSGTKSMSSLEFAKAADFLGLNIGASAADDQMSVYGSGLKKHMEKLLGLMTDALYNPSFPQDELEKLQKQTLSGLKTVHKSPDAVMSRLQITVGYSPNPYSNFQTEADVEAITRDDLVSFHDKYFIPNNASLAIVGDVTPDEILPIVKQYFGDWKQGNMPTNNFPDPKVIMGRDVHLVDLGKTQTQTEISVSASCIQRNNPDYIPLSMMNSILGGGFSGRLFANLREKHGFTYGAYSSIEGRRFAGMWNATASVRRIATDSAFTQILLEMNRMRDEKVDEDVLDMHKEYASGRFLLGLENPSSIASMVQNIDLYDLPDDYYRNYVSNLMAVTTDDVQHMAQKYLDPQNVALLAVGDASVIADRLKQFGPVKMYDTDMHPVSAEKSFEVDIDAPTLIKKHIAAIGGREKLEDVTSRQMEANVSLDFGMAQAEGVLSETTMAPGKKFQTVTLSVDMGGQTRMLESKQWVDGVHAAVQQPGQPAQKMSGEELASMIEDEQFNPVLRMAELGWTATVKAKKSMDKRVVYVVEMQKQHSQEEWYIDADNYLLIGKSTTAETPQGPITTMNRYSDYRDTDGVMLPYHMTVENPMMTMNADVTSYKHNIDVDESIFTYSAN